MTQLEVAKAGEITPEMEHAAKHDHIISHQWEEISQKIMHEMSRGVTIIEGQGGFTDQRQPMVYTVIALQELSRLKEIVRSLDPKAFIVVSDTLEVIGHRIGNQPHW